MCMYVAVVVVVVIVVVVVETALGIGRCKAAIALPIPSGWHPFGGLPDACYEHWNRPCGATTNRGSTEPWCTGCCEPLCHRSTIAS